MKASPKSAIRGQGLTEYLILLILISVVSIAAARTLGTTIKGKIQEAQRHINKDITVDGGGGGSGSAGVGSPGLTDMGDAIGHGASLIREGFGSGS